MSWRFHPLQLCRGCCLPRLWCAAGLGMLRTAPQLWCSLLWCSEAVPGVAMPRHRCRDGQVAGALLLWVWVVRAGRDCLGHVGRCWEVVPAVIHCQPGPAPSAALQSCSLPTAAAMPIQGMVRGSVGQLCATPPSSCANPSSCGPIQLFLPQIVPNLSAGCTEEHLVLHCHQLVRERHSCCRRTSSATIKARTPMCHQQPLATDA